MPLSPASCSLDSRTPASTSCLSPQTAVRLAREQPHRVRRRLPSAKSSWRRPRPCTWRTSLAVARRTLRGARELREVWRVAALRLRSDPKPRYKLRARVSLSRPAVLLSARGLERKRVMVKEPGARGAARASYVAGGAEAALRQRPGARAQGTTFACVSASAGPRFCTVPRARGGRG